LTARGIEADSEKLKEETSKHISLKTMAAKLTRAEQKLSTGDYDRVLAREGQGAQRIQRRPQGDTYLEARGNQRNHTRLAEGLVMTVGLSIEGILLLVLYLLGANILLLLSCLDVQCSRYQCFNFQVAVRAVL
jgi:hypothetical protein